MILVTFDSPYTPQDTFILPEIEMYRFPGFHILHISRESTIINFRLHNKINCTYHESFIESPENGECRFPGISYIAQLLGNEDMSISGLSRSKHDTLVIMIRSRKSTILDFRLHDNTNQLSIS